MLGDVTVTLTDGGHADEPLVDEVAKLAQQAVDEDGVPDLGAAVAAAVTLGRALPLPGGGRTASRFSALATLGAVDLTVARVVEPHRID